jgi:YD repeat-containing protein
MAGGWRFLASRPGTSFTDAVFEHTATPTRFFKARITWNDAGWDLRLKDGTVYTFDDAENAPTPGRASILGYRDRSGNEVALTRDDRGNLKQITSPHGRWIRMTYNTADRITQAQDSLGRIVLYTYDTAGRLWKVTDAATGVTEFTYDSAHRMLTIKDPRNITYLTNEYDSAGRVIKQTQADNSTFLFAYTLGASGRIEQVDVTNPRGFVRRITMNPSGYTLTDTDAFGHGAGADDQLRAAGGEPPANRDHRPAGAQDAVRLRRVRERDERDVVVRDGGCGDDEFHLRVDVRAGHQRARSAEPDDPVQLRPARELDSIDGSARAHHAHGVRPRRPGGVGA